MNRLVDEGRGLFEGALKLHSVVLQLIDVTTCSDDSAISVPSSYEMQAAPHSTFAIGKASIL